MLLLLFFLILINKDIFYFYEISLTNIKNLFLKYFNFNNE